ncbi:MAG: asparagine synthase (glutamine-hydrolyzing) [bacterium]|nr:asparagine synthase (glutamine-hydrolyzing) [bacterium]
MCGICGIFHFESGRPVDEGVLAKMCQTLAHRGPDDQGMSVVGPVGLAMQRLSIIDVAGGRQPIWNEDGRIGMVFNGEIYNFQDLREDLKRRGHRFQTRTDGEVIVHLYETFGVACVDHLRGMFAFALWDGGKQQLFLARDRLGIKPLYYALLDGSLIFASELKSLLVYPGVSREMDVQAFSDYLTFEYVPAPKTIFRAVRKLLPGEHMVLRADDCKIHRYWDPCFEPQQGRDEKDLLEDLRTGLSEAVRTHLVSDVPVGVLLSGGLDSSALVAFASHHLEDRVRTFSIGFQESDFNELDYARTVAKAFDTEHRELIVEPHMVQDVAETLVGVLDEPLADASVIPTYLVSQLARQDVKVVLSGDGGDELFGGYRTYKAYRIAQVYRKVPGIVRRGIRELVQALPASEKDFDLVFQAKKFTAGVEAAPEIANTLWWGAYGEDLKSQLLSDDVKASLATYEPFAPIFEHLKTCSAPDALDRIFYLDLKLYLQDGLLVKVDRASMANSLEVRLPFLDHPFVEFATGIPNDLKVRGLHTKYLLRKALRPLVPPAIWKRGKRGFDLPLGRWLRGELREFARDALLGGGLEDSGLFQPGFIRQICDEHFAGRHNHRQLLWPLIVFANWRQQYA